MLKQLQARGTWSLSYRIDSSSVAVACRMIGNQSNFLISWSNGPVTHKLFYETSLKIDQWKIYIQISLPKGAWILLWIFPLTINSWRGQPPMLNRNFTAAYRVGATQPTWTGPSAAGIIVFKPKIIRHKSCSRAYARNTMQRNKSVWCLLLNYGSSKQVFNGAKTVIRATFDLTATGIGQ